MKTEEGKHWQTIDFRIKAAWLAISKMYNMLGADYGISHSLGFALLNIDREHGTPATKIAPLMGMEARSLSRMLRSLEENELISRKTDPKDGRKVIVHLTEKGKLKRELSRQTVKVFNQKIETQIGKKNLSIFFEVIGQIHEIIEKQSHDILDLVRQRLASKGIVEEIIRQAEKETSKN